jgi:hypothetical protein
VTFDWQALVVGFLAVSMRLMAAGTQRRLVEAADQTNINPRGK